MRHGRAVLVGRGTELTALRHLLGAGSLATVVGPGGVGKTRLALAAADEVESPEPTVCELAGVTDPAQVAGVVGEALGFPSLPVALVGLAETERLLVLDNCEHVLDAVAEVAELLLQDCPRMAVLATSRQPLEVPGEMAGKLGRCPHCKSLTRIPRRGEHEETMVLSAGWQYDPTTGQIWANTTKFITQ